MANIRAYKLAEELGIDRHEFVLKAGEIGIELKNAMASLDDDQVAVLREKFGRASDGNDRMEERRVKNTSGTTVLRRRKRIEPEPALQVEPVPTPEEPASPVVEPSEEQTSDVVSEVESESESVDGAVVPDDDRGEFEASDDVASIAAESERQIADRRGGAASIQPDGGAAGATDRKGRQRKRVREVVNLQEQEKFARQITGRGGVPRRVATPASRAQLNPRRKRRDKLQPAVAARSSADQKRTIKVEGEISVGELAKLLGAKAPAIQGKLMALGTMVSVNQTVDVETARKVASDLGFEVQDVGFKEADFLEPEFVAAEGSQEISHLPMRAPIVTVMGHVDHGKTSLLDYVRNLKHKVVDSESGGITQHIGAYQVRVGDKRLTFIDTPGHAAFTAMRARGASVTDVVVLVVAANDGVMPQTVEAIQHAQAAGCPIVVAINKVDLPDADPSRVKQRLTEHGLVAEDFGGDVICCNVSAKTGEGIDHLLEMLSLQADVLELRADPARRAKGVVLEARLDKGRGAVATVLVQDGTLQHGDVIVIGTESGRVRVMENDLGERVKEAGPSMPVQVLGMPVVPSPGASFHVVESDRIAKQITAHREDRDRSRPVAATPRLTLEDFFAQAEGTGPKELSVILKADVQGTLEAVRDSLEQLSTDEVKLRVLSTGVGAISESDIMLATAGGAIVIGFHVRPDPTARRTAENNGIDVRTYTIIMELIDEVKAAMAGLLPPVRREKVIGRVQVLQTFTIPKLGTIAGSLVVEGKVLRGAHCRLVRDGVQVYEGRLSSLRRFKDDVREVGNGAECGIGIAHFNDVKVGDEIEILEVEEIPATL